MTTLQPAPATQRPKTVGVAEARNLLRYKQTLDEVEELEHPHDDELLEQRHTTTFLPSSAAAMAPMPTYDPIAATNKGKCLTLMDIPLFEVPARTVSEKKFLSSVFCNFFRLALDLSRKVCFHLAFFAES